MSNPLQKLQLRTRSSQCEPGNRNYDFDAQVQVRSGQSDTSWHCFLVDIH